MIHTWIAGDVRLYNAGDAKEEDPCGDNDARSGKGNVL